MSRIRKGISYRRLERANTRVSKYSKKAFIKTRPSVHIVKYDMGNAAGKYNLRIDLISQADFQARHNALEAARQTTNRLLETSLSKNDYFFKLRVYPHHILRENPLASGAGADRMSTGMARSFGKPIGSAARIKFGQPMFSVYCNKPVIDIVKKSLHRACHKLPIKTKIIVNNLK